MSQYTAIIRSLSLETFSEILTASARQARETYFHRHSVRAPKTKGRLPKPGAKNTARMERLYEVLKSEEDEEMAEEILRSWLLVKRPMLSAALDHLGIEHNEGLTDSEDLEKIEKLSVKELRALAATMEPHAAKEEILIYLKFMGAEKADEALA